VYGCVHTRTKTVTPVAANLRELVVYRHYCCSLETAKTCRYLCYPRFAVTGSDHAAETEAKWWDSFHLAGWRDRIKFDCRVRELFPEISNFRCIV